MRCKNCRKKIENPNYFRCPSCGKPIKKKEKKLRKNALNISFIAATVVFVVLNFFSLFFKCDYYSLPCLAVAVTVYLVAFPFIFGSGWSRSVSQCCAAAVSVPLLANWFVTFVGQRYALDNGGLYTVYFMSSAAIILFCDVLLILCASGVIGRTKLAAWICLGLGAASAAFSVGFYAYAGLVKPMAVVIIATNAFIPSFAAFYSLKKEQGNE